MQIGKTHSMKNIKYLGFISLIVAIIFFVKHDGIDFVSKYFADQTISEKPASPTDSPNNQTGIVDSIKKLVSTPGPLRVPAGTSENTATGEISASEILIATNKARADNGNLVALNENQKLDASARIKLNDMFTKQYFEHVSPSGAGIQNLAAQVGYDYIVIGENLALGTFKTGAEIVDAWMNSPGHRANILNNRYSEIGTAVGKGVFDGNTVWIAVQHFGLPLSACPEVNQALKADIDVKQAQLGDLDQEISQLRAQIDQENHNGSKYQEDVRNYNNLVSAYNSLLDQIKNKITEYNNEVAAFNACAN